MPTLASATNVPAGATVDIVGVTINGNRDTLNVDDYGSPDAARTRTGFPRPEGQSLSYWLQGVRANPLLDHRTTPDLPESADTVIIGSGVSQPVRPYRLSRPPLHAESPSSPLFRLFSPR